MFAALVRLPVLLTNLIPLAGVWWWGWSAFDVLMLYWMQTVLVVAFALIGIGKVADTGFGTITVNGKLRPATRRDFLLIFGAIGTIFCAAHLLFLLVLFSGEATRAVHGPLTFWRTFVIQNGAWAPLLLQFIGSFLRFLFEPPWLTFMRTLAQRVGVREPARGGQTVDALFVPLFVRLFVIQAAIIIGAMVSNHYGTMAPLLILIGLRTLADLADKPVHASAVTVSVKS